MSEIDVNEAKRRFEGGAAMLDVRNPDEWEAGHVDGSMWIPLPELGDRAGEVPTDREVLVICRSGARSARAAAALAGAGCDAVNVAGGAKAWVAAGHPFRRDDGSPGEVA
jgi:rhodanese-related sulfurtransferase